MNDSKTEKVSSRAPSAEELFYVKWGLETLKSNIYTATEVLKQLIAVNVALVGGGLAFFDVLKVGRGAYALILIFFILGLACSLIGVMSTESKVDVRVPKQIKEHKKKVLIRKRCFLLFSARYTLFGLY